ncbi:MAG: hypothetical protein V3U03_09455 [Myxococcota bacterium]
MACPEPAGPELPDESRPEGHPRRVREHSLSWAIAYDLIPAASPLRALVHWDPLEHFIGEVLERRPLYRMADPLAALSLTATTEGHVQGWRCDNTDFAVSLAIQSCKSGGAFECATAAASHSRAEPLPRMDPRAAALGRHRRGGLFGRGAE